MRTSYLFATACIAVLMLLSACHKQNQNDVSLDSGDSLAQSVYTVYRSGAAKETGNILLAPFNMSAQDDSSTIMLMDGEGHLLAQQRTPAGAINFRKWTISGQTRYTWFVYDQALYDPNAGGFEQGYEVIADGSLHQLGRVNLMAAGSITDVSHHNLDAHDFLLLADDHYIAMTYNRRMVNNVPASLGTGGAAYVATPVIQEVNKGQVVWQWEAADYPDFYTTSVEGNNFADQSIPQDYMHMNSMFLDPADGNLICSFRNCDQVVKINHQSGNIIWKLGGNNSDFPLTADMQFIRQHDASLTDDGHTLLLFDNGDVTLRPYSRIVEFQLDEETHSLFGFRAYQIPEPFTRFMGSVQKTGRHYFIGGGSGNYVLDVDYITGEKTLELRSALSSYRAYKF